MKMLALGFFLVIFPVFFGYAMEKYYKMNFQWEIRYWWEGFLLELLLFYIVQKCVIFFHGDFSDICHIYMILSAFLTIAALLFLIHAFICREKAGKRMSFNLWGGQEYLLGGVFLLFVGLQIIKSTSVLEIYPGDHMALDVSTIVADDSLFMSNPFTGLPYEIGQEPVEYGGLTVFYAFLTFVSGVNTMSIIYKLIPVCLLCLFYALQYSLGMDLFQKNKKKTFLYCIIIALANIFGTAKKWMLSAYLLLYPWTEEAVLVCLLLPITVWMMIKILYCGEKGITTGLLLVLLLLIAMTSGTSFYFIGLIVTGAGMFLVRRIKIYD